MTVGNTTADLVRAKFAIIVSDKASVEAKWDVPINDAVTQANHLVDSNMVARGYTIAQIATWNFKQETATELGALLVLEDIMTARPGPEAETWIRRMDRIEKWFDRSGDGNLPLTSAGVTIDGASHDDNWSPETERGPTDDERRQFDPVQEDVPGFGRNRPLRRSTTDGVLTRDC